MANLTDTKIFGQLTVSRNVVVQGEKLTLNGQVVNSARIAEWDSGGSSRVTGVSGTGNTTLTLTRDGETNLTTSLAHGHGNISSAGAIGTTAGLMVKTGASGVLTALAAGSSGQFLQYNGTWATPNYTVNTNYYPTAFDWIAGEADGPTGKLTISGATDVTFAAIPLASASASGVVSTGTQTFAGAKTFNGLIKGINGTSGIRHIVNNNTDVDILRVATTDAASAGYGFSFRYLGTGAGNENALALIADNQKGTQVESFRIKQDGTITTTSSFISSSLTAGRVLISDANKKIVSSDVTSARLSGFHNRIFDLEEMAAGSIVIHTNNVNIAAPSNNVNIIAGQSAFTFSKGTDSLLVFENGVYLLREGVDYTVSGESIVPVSGSFRAAEYNFLVFKNVHYAAGSGASDIAVHAGSFTAHGATSGSSPNRIAMRDGSGGMASKYLKIDGTSKVASSLYAGTSNPTSSTRLNYDGYLYATRVYNAVYNDLAEYFLKDKNTEKKERRVYSINDKGLAIISNKRADKNVLGIYSSSPAFVMKEEYREDGVLIALSGTVEAIYAGDLKPGDEVVSFKEGKVIKANFLEKTLKRSAIIGKVVKIIDKEKVLIKI